MIVMNKKHHEKLYKELTIRFDTLLDAFTTKRELNNSREGCSNRQHWVNPEEMCAIFASSSELRLAVEDFKNILAEIKKLK